MRTLIQKVELEPPYLLFLGDVECHTNAKTALGIAHWRPHLCLAQYRLGSLVDTGLPDMTPAEAVAAGARSLIVGVAPVGGAMPDSWTDALLSAARVGLNIVAGLHNRLPRIPGLTEAAIEGGARLIDVREPPAGLPIATGARRSGRRVLTVGTDCAVGKKYTALAIEHEMRERGLDVTFRATGQTGIMIAGEGIPIDAVISDFISGAAEVLSPSNRPEHWDVIEGQGSLFHPGYAGVTLGLLHGSQPDAVVLCHEATRTEIELWSGYPTPEIADAIARYLLEGRLTNPEIRCVGVSVNTSALPAAERSHYLRDLAGQVGVPCIDPLLDGVEPIVDRLELLG